jgi:lipopolysaccharide transport system ATP-binding protein
MTNAIEVRNVTKTFSINNKRIFRNVKSLNNKITALDDITFSVKTGEVLGIIGQNGSGKTTLLQTIAGLYSPDSGDIKVVGSLAPVLQIGSGFQPELSAVENIMIYGMLLGLSKNEIKNKINSILEYAELEKFSDLKLKHFSTGMQSRLAVAIVFQLDPDILLLDEILAVGDSNFNKKCFATFISLTKKHKTILVSTHALNLLPLFCDRVLLMDKGKLIAITSPDEAAQKFQDLMTSTEKN